MDAALEMFVRKGRASLVAVTPVTEHPMLMCTIDDDGMRHALFPGVNGTVRRQDNPAVYRTNGAIYINNADEITFDTSFNDNDRVHHAGQAPRRCRRFGDFVRVERALEEE